MIVDCKWWFLYLHQFHWPFIINGLAKRTVPTFVCRWIKWDFFCLYILCALCICRWVGGPMCVCVCVTFPSFGGRIRNIESILSIKKNPAYIEIYAIPIATTKSKLYTMQLSLIFSVVDAINVTENQQQQKQTIKFIYSFIHSFVQYEMH